MVLSPVLIIALICSILVIILIVIMIRLHIRLSKVLVGKNAKTLEDSIVSISKELSELKQFTKDMELYLTTVENRLKKSVQSVETIRFNPFKGSGSGGNNSFSTAFLNEHGDGVILTSMYARDRISMFAKPVKAYASEHELSEEERESIELCKKNLKTM